MRISFFSQPRCRLCAIVSLLETALRSDSRVFRGLRGTKLHGATLQAGIWEREIQSVQKTATGMEEVVSRNRLCRRKEVFKIKNYQGDSAQKTSY
jgi:hypothetical protein